MNTKEEEYKWLTSQQYVSKKHEDDKVIVFERGHKGLVWIFNFHSSKSFTDYKIGCSQHGKYKIIMDTDCEEFGGHSRLDHSTEFFSSNDGFDGRPHSLQIYIPCRVAILLALVD